MDNRLGQWSEERGPLVAASSETAHELAPCSIELKVSSKGEVYWEIKQYHAPGDEDEALSRLSHVHSALAQEYRPGLLTPPVGSAE